MKSKKATSLLFSKNHLGIAAGVNDAKNSYFSRLYAVEDHIVVDGKGADVGTKVRFEVFADVWEPGKQSELVCN